MVLWDDYLAAHGNRTAGIYAVCVVVLDENLTTLAFPASTPESWEITCGNKAARN